MIGALSTAISGLFSASQKASAAAESIANLGDGSNAASLPKDIVDIKIAAVEYKANLAVIKTANEMTDLLLKTFDEKV